MAALMTLQEIHKTYGDRHLLRGISLFVQERERVGLLGANGCGKTTLLRIAASLETADEGDVIPKRGLSVGYLEQEPVLPAAATLREAVREGLEGRAEVLDEISRVHAALEVACAGPQEVERLLADQARLEDRLASLGGYEVDHRVDALLAGLGLLDPNRTCTELSGGEARRVALARLLLSEPDLLLLDEPTNHLDVETIDWLEDYLLESRASLLMVTHDRYVLDRVVDRIIEVDGGVAHEYVGGYGDYLVARMARLEGARRVESARCNLLRRETAWMRRGPPARSTKAKARIDRYEDLVDAAPERSSAGLEFRLPPGPRLGTKVLATHGLTKAFDGRTVLRNLDLELGAGERLGIIGPNGAGKSTLLRLLEGVLEPDAGSVIVGETVRFASIDQKRTQLDPYKTVSQEVAGVGAHVRVGEDVRRVESFLDQFLFAGDQKHALVGKLSGGERNRVLLAKLLCAGGNVLLLDEPTNDLDLMTLRALEEALVAFPGTVLVVSHDRYFLDRVATRVVHLDGEGNARQDACAVSRLIERMVEERKQAERSEENQVRAKRRAAREADAVPPASAPKRLSNWEQNEYDALPDRIAAAEALVVSLDEQLAQPDLYAGPREKRREVEQKRAAAEQQVLEAYARWEQLEERSA